MYIITNDRDPVIISCLLSRKIDTRFPDVTSNPEFRNNVSLVLTCESLCDEISYTKI